MKVFTFLPALILAICCSTISAKPVLPSFSVSSDGLDEVENHGYGENNSANHAELDSATICKEALLFPTLDIFPDVCGQGIGSIDLTPDPGGPYTYEWSNGETTQDISGLTPGTYSVTITDPNGNKVFTAGMVGSVPPIFPQSITGVVTGNTLCNGSGDGTIDVTVTPVIGPWTYLWSNGETTLDIANLAPGTYTISVTYGVTCTATAEFTVPNLTNAPTLIPPIGGFPGDFCETSNGSAAIQALGGAPPYTYLWSNGGTDFTINNLTAGEYTVTVTGTNGCSNSYTGMVNALTLAVMADLSVMINNTTCIGGNGSIDINVTPFAAALVATYEWSNGATTQDITGLTGGYHTVIVTRLGNCKDTTDFLLSDIPHLPVFNLVNTNAICGLSTGSVVLNLLTGGPALPNTYQWSNGETTQSLANIPPGDYSVTVTGSNGCTATGSATVPDVPIPIGLSATIIDQTSCDTTLNGLIALTISPPNLPFVWSNGATTKTIKNLTPGSYTVTVSAGGTCVREETYVVNDLRDFPNIPAVPSPSLCGLPNGSINMTITGGGQPFEVLWSTGDTSQDLSQLVADTFFVTVTNSAGCSSQNAAIVTNINPAIDIIGNSTNNISCALPTGSVFLDVVTTDSLFLTIWSDTLLNYMWSSGHTADSLFNLSAGDYLVTVSYGPGCIDLDTFAVANTAFPPSLSTSATATNCDFSNGAVDLNVSGGTGPFGYLWSNAATTEDLVNLAPGTYSVTVTGLNSCTAVSAATVLNNNVALSVSGTPIENNSCAVSNGSLDISVTPSGVYNYLWSNTATSEDLNNLGAGTYTVTVSLGTCLSSNSFTILDNAVPPNLSASGNPATCSFSNGSADLSVNGGMPPYSYFWSNAATTEDLSNLAPGNYSVTVTGANSCTAVGSANVLNNNIAINLSAAPQGNTSCTNSNGSLDLSVAPAGSYIYLWSNSATDEDLSNLSSGSYTVTVSLGSCQSSSTFAVADNTAAPVLTTNITASICSVNNGAIELSVTGPAGPYAYLWSNTETTEDIANLLPGNYSVTVTAASGCTRSATLNVPNNASTFTLTATPAPLTNCAANNGAIDLDVTPAGAYTYLWSNTATTQDLSGLPPGTYTVSVTESGSCTATASYFVVDQRSSPAASQSVAPEVCGLSNGSIDLGVSGGTAPFGYLWNSGHVIEDLVNIAAGTYTVTVTDANNCTATASATVPGNSISFALAGSPSANSSCILNNGAIDLSVNPPGGVSYLWSNMAVTEDLTGLPAGTYTVTVSAGGNCTNTAAFNVASNVPSPLLSSNIAAASCGAASGSINLSVSGSPAPYQYFWSNAATTEDLANILSGTFTVTVTAANGCTTVDNFSVPENSFSPAIASTLTPLSSCTLSNGAIDLTINPAVPGYSFNWSSGQTSEDLSNLPAGTYTVTVSAGGACSSTSVLTVTSSIPLPVLSPNIAAASCGAASGGIDLSVAGSPAPYQYFWSNAATTEDLANILSGTFSVTVTAANGCTSVGNYTVPENVTLPQISGAPTADNSCVTNNGAIDLTAGPATGYLFTWSNGVSTEDIANLPAGSYTVTVNGGGACTGTASFVVAGDTPAPALSDNIVAASCGQASGGINLSVAGSPAPYQYFWSNAATTEDLANILSGSFSVTVTAANGCTSVGNYTVPENVTLPLISGAPTADNSCVTNNGAINLTAGPATGYLFTWSNGASTEDIANLPAGSYTVTVNGGGACTGTASFVVADQTTQPQAGITAATTALDCSTTSTVLNGSVTGTPNPSNFQWSYNGTPVGNGTNSLTVNAPGQYILVVTDNVTSCTASASIAVTQSLNPPQLSIANPGLLTCTSPSQALTGSSTVGGVQFSWVTINGLDTTFLATGATLSVSAPGTYYLIGLNPANNCLNAASVNVAANQAPPTADAGPAFTLDCAGETAALNGNGSGAPNLIYQWATQDGHFVSGANTSDPLIDKAGTYVLSVT
ncbi:MAG: hypothetical protein ACKVT2_11465, partial [Saprospiraceae bacterium]